MKDMAKAWAEYYASFKPHSRLDEEIEQPEEDEEDSESLIEVEICTTPEPREKKPRETKAQKVKRLMEELLFRRAYEAEIKRRATRHDLYCQDRHQEHSIVRKQSPLPAL